MNQDNHTYLFSVSDRFKIENRGLILAPGIPWNLKLPPIKRGAALLLKTPLGDSIHTHIQEFEMISYRPGSTRLEATPILLPKNIHKFDIPVGTEVYWIENPPITGS